MEPAQAIPSLPVGKFADRSQHAEVAAIVVTYNSASDISALIADLRTAAQDLSIRVVVADNQSSDDTVEVVRQNDDVILVESGGNLGYGGGINAALPFRGRCDNVLFLNPDLRLRPGALKSMVAAIRGAHVGAVVPLILDEEGKTSPSLCREPSLSRSIGDALLGSKVRVRPGFSSEIDHRPSSYVSAHNVDWATGAIMLVRSNVVDDVGDWYEDFFMYSEEIEYCRRIRESGRTIRFEPSAVVMHRRSGSGRTPEHATLMAVNRIRYIELYHSRGYSLLFRAAVILAHSVRSYDANHRRTLGVLSNRRRWQQLPSATKKSAG